MNTWSIYLDATADGVRNLGILVQVVAFDRRAARALARTCLTSYGYTDVSIIHCYYTGYDPSGLGARVVSC